MIADGSCRMVRSQLDGFALWQDPDTTAQVIEALKDVLPPTGKPSHFVLSAHEVLEDICPMEAAVNTNEEYSCRGGGHDLEVMAGAMHNWHRAVCARETDPEWEVSLRMLSIYLSSTLLLQGEFDPAYQPQQVALTAGFMCIIACDCNEAMLPGSSLAYFAETPETANVLHDLVCSSIPWGSIDFADGSSDVEVLAELSAPLLEVCGCAV